MRPSRSSNTPISSAPTASTSTQQLDKLKKEFAGKINVAFQFFPLEGLATRSSPKRPASTPAPARCPISRPGTSTGSRRSTTRSGPTSWSARNPEWRRALAKKYGAEEALTDLNVRDLVERIINTGAEYEKTSDKYSHGIRSTPTMIINNRMVIGTLPYEHMKAIFQALVDERESGGRNSSRTGSRCRKKSWKNREMMFRRRDPQGPPPHRLPVQIKRAGVM